MMNLAEEIKKLRELGYIEGELEVNPFWYILWEPEKISEHNQDYQFSKYAPEYTGFGSSGSNELLAVNNQGQVFTIPAIGMESKYAEKIAENINEFKQYLQKSI